MIFGKHPHQNEWTWDQAPPWAIELGAMILYTWEQEMAAIDDLKSAVAGLAAEVAALHGVAENPPPSSPGVTDADLAIITAQITPLTDTLKAVVAKLSPSA